MVLSLLRYPGGKRWMLPYARRFAEVNRPKVFLEPFAGGAVVGMSLLASNAIKHLVMVEKDARVAAFWREALTSQSFAKRVEAFKCTRRNVERICEGEQDAFWVLVKNRCSFAGVLDGAGLMRKGDGRGVASRWNRKVLGDNLRQVCSLRNRVVLIEGDGVQALEGWKQGAFIDPPYLGAGSSLYRHWKVDPGKLMKTLTTISGPWFATYDPISIVENLAKVYEFSTRRVMVWACRGYAYKPELIIGRNLDWFPRRLAHADARGCVTRSGLRSTARMLEIPVTTLQHHHTGVSAHPGGRPKVRVDLRRITRLREAGKTWEQIGRRTGTAAHNVRRRWLESQD